MGNNTKTVVKSPDSSGTSEPQKPSVATIAAALPPNSVAIPSEHVPTFLIEERSGFSMNVDKSLTFTAADGGVQAIHSEGYLFRRMAVLRRVVGVPEPIYQNTDEVNHIEIWLQTPTTGAPHVIFDNQGQTMRVTFNQRPNITAVSVPDLGNRFDHTHPGFGGGPFQIERIVIKNPAGDILFQNKARARDYVIVLYRQHE